MTSSRQVIKTVSLTKTVTADNDCVFLIFLFTLSAFSAMGDGLALLRSLSQVNCVLLTPLLLKAESRGSNFPFVRIIEQLRVTGLVYVNKTVPPVFCGDVTHQTDQILAFGACRFDIVGSRMVWLTQSQAQQYLRLTDSGNFNLVSWFQFEMIKMLSASCAHVSGAVSDIRSVAGSCTSTRQRCHRVRRVARKFLRQRLAPQQIRHSNFEAKNSGFGKIHSRLYRNPLLLPTKLS